MSTRWWVVCLWLWGSAGATEVFKWTDENGKVHYGDQKAAPETSDRMEVNGESPRERRLRHFHERQALEAAEREAENRERAARRQAEDAGVEQREPPPPPRASGYAPPSRPTTPSYPEFPPLPANRKSVPVGPERVGPQCKGLVDQIARVKKGEPWPELARKFNEACPGIAYECSVYKRHQKPDKCQWIEREGNTMLLTNIYE